MGLKKSSQEEKLKLKRDNYSRYLYKWGLYISKGKDESQLSQSAGSTPKDPKINKMRASKSS